VSSTTVLYAVISVFAAAIAAVGGYLSARRQRSGRISTTEAATLWAESDRMRHELRDEVIALRHERDNAISERDNALERLRSAGI
jgi:hypothetical protein